MPPWGPRPRARIPEIAPGLAVVVLGLTSAITWGAGDYGGGLLSRRLPLFGVVFTTQIVGMAFALVVAIARGEPVPAGADLGWSLVAGACGVVGMTSLYRGLAVGRMGVVAPTTGVVGAIIPVTVGFLVEGVPRVATIAGIVVALVAVVLVTRAPGHGSDRPSGASWAFLAGTAIGGFNVAIGQLSGAGAFGPLVIIRLVQTVTLVVLVVAWRQPWRIGRRDVARLGVVGVLDMAGNAAFIGAAQVGALAVASVLSSLYPVTTVLLAIGLLHEHVSRSHVVGIVLTAVAIALIAAGTATL
jgi:drug/metabolite transporter (DMT)-like permease